MLDKVDASSGASASFLPVSSEASTHHDRGGDRAQAIENRTGKRDDLRT